MQKIAVPEQVSPFMNGAGVVQRIMRRHLDLVKAGDKSAADAMRDAARDVERADSGKISGKVRRCARKWEQLVRTTPLPACGERAGEEGASGAWRRMSADL
jgi:hypothetical protein